MYYANTTSRRKWSSITFVCYYSQHQKEDFMQLSHVQIVVYYVHILGVFFLFLTRNANNHKEKKRKKILTGFFIGLKAGFRFSCMLIEQSRERHTYTHTEATAVSCMSKFRSMFIVCRALLAHNEALAASEVNRCVCRMNEDRTQINDSSRLVSLCHSHCCPLWVGPYVDLDIGSS